MPLLSKKGVSGEKTVFSRYFLCHREPEQFAYFCRSSGENRRDRITRWHDECFSRSPMAYKVLVVEDNTDCRELFAMIIRHLGCEVIEAADGEIGVQKALTHKPDIIFMDVGLPSMNGLEATACLRESATTREVPIIICTAWMADKYRESAIKCGAHAVIVKPVSVNELQTVLLRYLPLPKDAAQLH